MTIELHNNVYCEGEGLPVVLVHGFPVDHRMWDECAEALEAAAVEHGVKRFPIWGPDMPGAGEGRFLPMRPVAAKTRTALSRTVWTIWPTPMSRCCMRPVTTRRFGRAFRWAAIWFSTFSVCTRSCCRVGIVRHEAAADSAQMRAKRIAIAEACESTGTHEPVMGFAASTPEDSTIKQSAAYREQFTTWINEQPAEGIAWRERMALGARI